MGSYQKMGELLSLLGANLSCQKNLWITRNRVVIYCTTHNTSEHVTIATEVCPN